MGYGGWGHAPTQLARASCILRERPLIEGAAWGGHGVEAGVEVSAEIHSYSAARRVHCSGTYIPGPRQVR